MSDLNLGRLISRYVNYQSAAFRQSYEKAPSEPLYDVSLSQSSSVQKPQTAEIARIDQSAYVKDMMKLPKNMNELLYILQRNITLSQFNQKFLNLQGRNPLSQTQAQILAQLQGLSFGEDTIMSGNKAFQMQSLLRNLPISSSGMINLSDIAVMIQANGKDAIAKLVTTMANSAKLGINDLTQLKETAKIINASIAAASKNDNAQTMKLLMLLYLPWLPLQEGTGFDLEIETALSGKEKDSVLIITISTINFANVTAVLILENSNSVHVNIECISDFPKDELLMRIENEQKHYSMESVVSFETNGKKNGTQKQAQTRINMSNTNEINPFLLLMAHTIIKHVMEIDRNASKGVVTHFD